MVKSQRRVRSKHVENEDLVKQLTSPLKNSRLEKFGKTITFLCLASIVFIVAMILLFVAQKD